MSPKKWLAALFSVVMVIAMLPVAASAANERVEIDSNEDLVNAIINQEDGQTWVFTAPGEYDAKNTTEGSAGNYDVPDDVYSYPFALPIYVDNLTITKADGVGEVTLTSSYTPDATSGGNWHNQNFITVYGSGLTIENINLEANRNEYYGTCNKVIELTGNAKNFALSNVDIIPVENSEGTSFGGSIYFGVADAGNTTISNVNMDAWISASNVTSGTVAITNLTQDFTNSEYAGYTYEGSYGWNPFVKGSQVTVDGYTIIVDDKTNLSEQIFTEDLRDGTTIQLMPGDYNLTPNNTYSVEGQTGWYMPITKSVTIQGVDANGNVITDASQTQANLYSTHYSSNGSWPSQNLITVFADDVVIEGVTIMNKVDPNKAVEVVGSDNLNTFTVRNCKFAPISEDLVDQAAIDAGYNYSEYAQFGASLYLSATGKYAMDVNVENNLFSYSTLSLGATTEGNYNITGNVFDGAKNWNQDPDYYYSSIGYQGKWLYPNPDCTSLGSANVNISGNDFTTAGSINFSQIVTGDQVATFSGNTGLDEKTVSGPVEVDGQILVDSEEALKVAIAAADEDDTIVLTKDIELDAMLDITKSNITIDLNGNTITASDSFTGTYDNDKHLLQVNGAENVTIANGSIVTTDANKHGVNLYDSTGVVLKDVTIDHTNAMKGAPLVLNNSSATVEGKLDLVVGDSSWYGINIDPKDGQASLTFAEGSHVAMTGNDKLSVIQLDGEQANITITGAEDAGLDDNGDGTYGPHTHVYDTSKWLNDETNHWHECSCGEKADVATHTLVWITDKEATATQAGSKHQECSVCGYKLAAVEIPATGDNGGNTGDNGNAGNTGDNGNTGNTGNNTNNTTNNGPKTGDNSNITFAVIAMLVACCGVVAILVYNGKIKAAYHGKHVSDK